jgi:aarF domain-containing kinase
MSLTAIRKLLPFGLNTRYYYHDFELDAPPESTLLVPDRPVFRAISRAVPASPLSRVVNFAMLGTSLIGGTVSTAFKQGFSGSWADYAMNDDNIDRLSEGLLKMRGAALKLGQFMSFQDNSKMPTTLMKAMERTRKEAYVMPEVQIEMVMRKNLGKQWRDNFDSFEITPFAAASIGQVHKAVFKGNQVAVKIQYPGVAESINSDLSNLKKLITWTNLIPRGLFVDEMIESIKVDLTNECDYLIEAQHQRRFRELLADRPEYAVPEVYEAVSGPQVLVSEFLKALTLEELAAQASQKLRDSVGTRILSLTLREIFEFKYMQTDPNPANFQYDPVKDTLQLLDFGATRSFGQDFLNSYKRLVIAGIEQDREAALDWSYKIKYLNGKENPAMIEAHVQALFTVGEPFRTPGLYDFGKQSITDKVYKHLPTMMQHRECPPPPETYTLHRKLSGAFLLCMQLKSRVPGRRLFQEVVRDSELI